MTEIKSHRRLTVLAFFIAILILFYFATRPAYKAYFSGDDLDKLGWPTLISSGEFFHHLSTPAFSPNLIRPVGLLYYRIMGRAFHLKYWPYVAVLQAGHILNVILLFLLLRRLELPDFAACAGSLFYIFHVAVLDIYWQPQFIYEVLACMLALVTMLLYARGRWILALIPFWFAYKAKEIVVMLPVVLLAFEMLLGARKWKRLIPYFLISLNFGLQALWNNRQPVPASEYILRFTPQVLWHTIVFYSSAIVFLPFAGFALLLLPLFIRDRRLYVGIIFMLALFLPMLVLPGRLESVYWYIPLVGVAIVFAVIATRAPHWAIVLFFLVWLPVNYGISRGRRSALLDIGNENRFYTTGLLDYARKVPPLKAVVYQGFPPHLGAWGVTGAIHQAFGYGVEAVWYQDARAAAAAHNVPMAIVDYDPVARKVNGIFRTRDQLESYIRFPGQFWTASQFGAGWYDQGSAVRWIAPRAEAEFYRPGGASQFEIVATVPQSNIEKEGPSAVTLLEEGRPLGTAVLSSTQPLHWKLSAGAAGGKHLTILSKPARHGGPQDPRDLGIAIKAIGYRTAAQ
jgi:hypothetical protein